MELELFVPNNSELRGRIKSDKLKKMNKIDLKQLADFLDEANKSTYADKDASKTSSSRLKSEDYHFEKDGLAYHDTYFGSRDFIGEEIVYKDNEPVRGLNYAYRRSNKISRNYT